MNVLLVNTSGESEHTTFVPLALLKLSTKHKGLNDNVEFVIAGKKPKSKPDIIYFSLIFAFKKKNDLNWINGYAKIYKDSVIKIGGISVTLNYDFFNKNIKHKNYEIIKGLVPELDNYIPDYKIAGLNYSYGFTSRGCHRKCDWCCVPKTEGITKIIDNWKLVIDVNHDRFIAFDNNILFTNPQHLENVLKYISDNNMKIEFNQAMDAELFVKRKEEMYPIFLKYQHIFIRFIFSWDSERCNDFIKNTMEMISGFKTEKNNVIFMLFDIAEQKPEDFLFRIQFIYDNFKNVHVKPMRFINVMTGQYPRPWGSIGDMFSAWLSNSFNHTGQIPTNVYDRFLKGINFDEFKELSNELICWKKLVDSKYHPYTEFIDWRNNLKRN